MAADPLARLAGLHPKSIDLSLRRIERLLTRLGDPQDRLPRSSTSRHQWQGLGRRHPPLLPRSGGQARPRLHLAASGPLQRTHRHRRREIDDEALGVLIDEVEAANAGDPITFFEIATALAMLAFAREPADATLLETGLGGRLDATNVVRPAVAAITPVGLDHQAWLGDSLAEIAAEKAAILKAGAPAVIAPQPPAARDIVMAYARRVGAPVVEWSARPREGGFDFRSRRREARFPAPALFGAHQIVNAGVALACLDAFESLSDAALARGLAAARWPGRLQRLSGPREVWLDGGHNPPAGEALAAVADGWRDKPLRLVVGMMRGKEPRGFLAPLAARAAGLVAVPVPNQKNAFEPAEVAAAGAAVGIAAGTAGSTAEALARIDPGDRVLVCGSLYLIGALLAAAPAQSMRNTR